MQSGTGWEIFSQVLQPKLHSFRFSWRIWQLTGASSHLSKQVAGGTPLVISDIVWMSKLANVLSHLLNRQLASTPLMISDIISMSKFVDRCFKGHLRVIVQDAGLINRLLSGFVLFHIFHSSNDISCHPSLQAASSPLDTASPEHLYTLYSLNLQLSIWRKNWIGKCFVHPTLFLSLCPNVPFC